MCTSGDNLLHSGNDVKVREMEESWIEVMAAADKVHNEYKSEAMEEDAILAVGDWESLLKEGDTNNVDPTVIQATVFVSSMISHGQKPNTLTFSISL